MKPTSLLAYMVDRKILHAEEENYLRLDLNAHEKLKLPQVIAIAKENPIKSAFAFILTAMLIFAGLFLFNNVKAYTKILSANLQAAEEVNDFEQVAPRILEARESAIETEDGIPKLNITVTSPQNRLRIPALNTDVPFSQPILGLEALKSNNWNELEDQIRDSLLKGPVHYPGTADPGQQGNVFITGHSSNVFWEPSAYNTVFALLPKLQEGDDIYLTFNQKDYHYKVTGLREVTPEDVSILAQGKGHTLTLMTCTPVGTNLKRLVVTAEQVKN